MRATAALAALIALLVVGSAAALAQAPTVTATPGPTVTPTPSPSPSPTSTPVPPSQRTKAVKKVYKDYRDDGVIEACNHTRKTLKKTLRELDPQADIDTPDLRPALEAAIAQHLKAGCDRNGDGKFDSRDAAPPANNGSGTGSGSGSGSPSPTTTPAPNPTAAPTSPPSSGSVTPLPTTPAPTPKPPSKHDVVPLTPSPSPAPPAATPPPAEPTGPPPAPTLVYTNADDGLPVSILVLAGLLGLLALLALAYAALRRLGWGDQRLAGVRRAWHEAAFRAGGTWGDFADWMRVGR